MQQPIRNALQRLSENPRHEGTIKLKSQDHLFRVRVGDYRIIYTIRDKELIVLVLEVGDRKEVYK